MPENDTRNECRCGHGRPTHLRYLGACGLCECAAVRPTEVGEGE